MIHRLLDAGVDVNARMTRNGMRDGQRNRFNRLGATAFMLAAKVTDVETMRLLLESGANPTIPTADGTTPLMVAAGLAIWNPGEDGGSFTGQEAEVLEAVRITLEGDNDVNARNYRGETALHGVGFRGVNIVLDYLVEQGADLTALTVDGWSALAIARGLSYTDFYKAQVHTAARLEELMRARGLDTEGGRTGYRGPSATTACRPGATKSARWRSATSGWKQLRPRQPRHPDDARVELATVPALRRACRRRHSGPQACRTLLIRAYAAATG